MFLQSIGYQIILSRQDRLNFYCTNSVSAEKLPEYEPMIFGRLPYQTCIKLLLWSSQLKASVVRLKSKVNVNVCLQKGNLRPILKRNNLTFSNKDSNSRFHLFSEYSLNLSLILWVSLWKLCLKLMFVVCTYRRP